MDDVEGSVALFPEMPAAAQPTSTASQTSSMTKTYVSQ